jgi:1,2-diacylglycerol 3-beta-galactosyltransferase
LRGGTDEEEDASMEDEEESEEDAADSAVVRKKIVFLIMDTGGGHRASAEALDQVLKEISPEGSIETKTVDMWTEYGCWPVNKGVWGYKTMTSGRPWLPVAWGLQIYRLLFYLSPFTEIPWMLDTKLRCGKAFRKFFEDEKPDLVVSIHPLTQNLPLDVLNDIAKDADTARVPFATVCTDLGTAFNTWFHSDVDACFVPSDTLHKQALRRGIAPGKIRQYGLPVRSAFARASTRRTRPPASNFEALGLDPARKTVLVMSGGEGAGNLGQIVRSLATELKASSPGEAQIVAICGKNAVVKKQLEKQKGLLEGRQKDVSLVPVGFTSQISEYMEIADVLVTKAGPGTIAEATIRGVPTMLSSHLPGQEWGNVDIVVKGGFGDFSEKPEKIASTVSGWLQDEEKLREMKKKALAMGRPDATRRIAEDLLGLLDESFSGPQRARPGRGGPFSFFRYRASEEREK